MLINGKHIAEVLEKGLKKEFKELKKKKKSIKLVVFLIGNSPEQLSFVSIKKKLAKRLGVDFEFIHLKTTPPFIAFVRMIKKKSFDPKTTGIIIQQPLPSQLNTDSVYDFIALEKEIEGHRKKTSFFPPLGLAVITIFKYIYIHPKIDSHLLINIHKDLNAIKKVTKHKKVVIIGRGITGGKPIGKTLAESKINFVGINSQTPHPEDYCKEADIIITAVGKKVLNPLMVKQGVILINVGMRKEKTKMLGDFDEKEMKSIASYYTPTPGGLGPLDVLYLFKNLLDAAKMQK
ncbi:hypothetical protein COY87_02995 [Candidatus Roizmanbacteria bacterium CG_4_10_14_0_8_um_filter_33_9]|uniref:Methenyltetrahydrofolate cyclohydrolase n=1 Tax=Candidatus Roizmanbacteria bacterium CG_4_10_14_0_8_um_filter_33_9 TaxID=1974826 RepID=A0A2M7QJE1_9BACT|nr:MAG: hypothetical protein COY87_02995 [Candidatus Roizmanbacteria bacterium CG_4_10_14_0_8_um_filter_33_9]